MKKKRETYPLQRLWILLKKTLAMRLSLLLILIFSLPSFSTSYAQKERISLKANNIQVEEVINQFRELTNYRFLFNHEEISGLLIPRLNLKDASIEEAMGLLLKNSRLSYIIKDDVIIISPKPGDIALPQAKAQVIRGKVLDSKKIPLPGVTILLKNTKLGVTTDEQGQFSMTLPDQIKPVLIISFIGMKTQEIPVSAASPVTIVLEEEQKEMDEVVVTGFFNRNKNSFTGNAKIVKGEELKTAGNQNILKSLSIIDPSLGLIESNNQGSNPNVMPKIRFRGESQFQDNMESLDKSNLIGDPNLPTFILDGYQTSIEKIVDLDMNRVESVTILKDAAATAIYGSRAANGVIVVKTKQPTFGKLQVSYNLDMDFNFPDLRSYDLLSPLECKQLYDEFSIYKYSNGTYQPTYLQMSKWIAEGVNTDWLAQPVRNAVGHKHSLNLMGGDQYMRYSFDLRYADAPGIMKESNRRNLGIGLNLQYNLKDKVLFSNHLEVNKNNQEESPYGSFSGYTQLNPFFPMYDSNGQLTKYFNYPSDQNGSYEQSWWSTYSPIPYNLVNEARVGNMDKKNYIDITNNFAMEWSILEGLRVRGQFSYTYNLSKTEKFLSPNSLTYLRAATSTADEDRGKFTYTDTKTEKYDGNIILTYMRNFGQHFLNFAGGINFSENKNLLYGFVAQGFGANDAPSPAFAKGYETGGAPQSAEGKVRLFGALASLNYSYANKYLLDLSYRLDGSSQFGTREKQAPFFSSGIGWNVHNEKFLEPIKMINHLKLRSSYGETGSVNFAPYQAKDMYEYYKNNRYDGNVGAHLMALGNENLRWQNTISTEAGIEIGLFKYIDLSFSYYHKKTQNMVLPITTPPSVGFDSFTENMGRMENKGYDISLRSFILKNENLNLSIYANATHNSNKILAISNSLTQFNNRGEDPNDYQDGYGSIDEVAYNTASHKFLTKYEPGKSSTAIYAVRSLGIDPMTGQEFFLTREGKPTLIWDAKDKVVVGDTEPTLRGNFGTNASWKGFQLNLTFMYEFGGQIYNQTMVDKVENSDKRQNVDKRVMEETWRKPGDIVRYKTNISSIGGQEFTLASSRFVQDNNLLRLSAASLQYELPQNIVSYLKMESIRLSFNMSDIVYLSTVKRERGTDYPFARSFTLGLRVNF